MIAPVASVAIRRQDREPVRRRVVPASGVLCLLMVPPSSVGPFGPPLTRGCARALKDHLRAATAAGPAGHRRGQRWADRGRHAV